VVVGCSVLLSLAIEVRAFRTEFDKKTHQRIDALGHLLVSTQVPKSVAQLLYNGTESISIANLTKRLDRPRTDGNDEYACISRCELGSVVYLEHTDETYTEAINCSRYREVVECVDKCTSESGLYARFMHKNLVAFEEDVCSRDPTAFLEEVAQEGVECYTSILVDQIKTFKLLKHALGLYLEFEDAKNNKEACYVLKYGVFDSMSGQLLDLCNGVSKKSMNLAKFLGVFAITIMSDGHLEHTCPIIYQ